MKDRDIVLVSRMFWLWTLVSLLLPPLVGGLVTMSWQGALTAFFWGSLVRVCLLHHVTWSINSICHTVGERPFMSRDKSGNVWWLAILSMGESWHNLHHATRPAPARRSPRAARHLGTDHLAPREVRLGLRGALAGSGTHRAEARGA